jgi:uncharacterized membrane protein YagU involved in acid resistance
MSSGQQRQDLRRWAVAGAVGGVAGGIAMTVLITKVAPHVLPADMRPSKPAPQKAVEWAERQVGKPQALAQRPEDAVALAGHLAYSAVTGAGYGLARHALGSTAERLPVPATGVLFGLVVWAASFEGLLPALGVKKRTTQHPPKRWLSPLMGHSVFGVVTAVLSTALHRRAQRH